MIQQTVTRYSLSSGGRCNGRARLVLRRSLSLAALVFFALLPARAYSQYSQPAQTFVNGNYTAQNMAVAAPDAAQFANQADQQLFSEARLFEQQGLTAQAQRIYLELQRRSMIRAQSGQATASNRGPSAVYPNGLRAPAAMTAASWTPAPRPSNASASPTNSTSYASSYSAPNSAAQPTPQVEMGQPAVASDVAPVNSSSGNSFAQAPVMVLDRQITPPAPGTQENASGWRPAITPLPAALVHAEPPSNQGSERPAGFVAGAPLELKPQSEKSIEPTPIKTADASTTHTDVTTPNAPRALVADQSAITRAHPLKLDRQTNDPTSDRPDIPVLPFPDMPSASREVAKHQTVSIPEPEPAAFVPPAPLDEHRLAATAATEPAGVVNFPSAVPTALPLSPKTVPRPVPFQADQESAIAALESAAKLAKQTDDIRIIPGGRGGHSRLEDLLNVGPGPNKESTASDPPATGWKSYTPTSPATTAQDARPVADASRLSRDSVVEAPTPPRHVHSDSFAEPNNTGDASANQVARSPRRDEEKPEPKLAFDLAGLIKDPEFREIHTRPVLDALELLSQAEPRHRLLGAMRITASGPEARTALPALRQLLSQEPNKAVRLRIAEGILKLQPNDRAALEILSQMLVEPSDAELRQAAAGAMGSAWTSGNLTAIVRLTDALDDPSPRVRIMAALSLAQFGAAASDAVPRLEIAATSDVPRMQRAALVALAAIRGRQVSQEPAPLPNTFVDSRPAVAPPAPVAVPIAPVPLTYAAPTANTPTTQTSHPPTPKSATAANAVATPNRPTAPTKVVQAPIVSAPPATAVVSPNFRSPVPPVSIEPTPDVRPSGNSGATAETLRLSRAPTDAHDFGRPNFPDSKSTVAQAQPWHPKSDLPSGIPVSLTPDVPAPASIVETPTLPAAPTIPIPMRKTPVAPKSDESASGRSVLSDRENAPSPAPLQPLVLPVSQGVAQGSGKFDAKATTADAPAMPQPPAIFPTRGISLHEIESDGANAEARSRHQGEPPRFPDMPARPIEPTAEKTPAIKKAPTIEKAPPPRPAPTPKAAPAFPAPPPPPLTDDSPLNLESQSGASKPGSAQ